MNDPVHLLIIGIALIAVVVAVRSLLRNNLSLWPPPKRRSFHNSESIFDAVRSNNVRRVRRLLRRNPSLATAEDKECNIPEEYCETPLHRAAGSGSFEIAQLLLSAGAECNERSASQETPLHCALKNNHTPIVKLLLEQGANPNAGDDEGNRALHLAVANEQEEVVRLLLDHKADVNCRNGQGRTPLHVATEEYYIDIAELLIAKGADVNAREANGNTPLHIAAWGGFLEIVELLLERGSKVSIDNYRGRSPLFFAQIWFEISGQTDIVDLLNKWIENIKEHGRSKTRESHDITSLEQRERQIRSEPRRNLATDEAT
jgi:Ankyrin repeats (3 copies)/Ankyrin repeats (many copies)/Ankyrin repeat